MTKMLKMYVKISTGSKVTCLLKLRPSQDGGGRGGNNRPCSLKVVFKTFHIGLPAQVIRSPTELG